VQELSTAIVDTVLRQSDWFEDRTKVSQLKFEFSTGRGAGRNTILETVGGGLGISDFDNDGWSDLFCVGGREIDPSNINSNRDSIGNISQRLRESLFKCDHYCALKFLPSENRKGGVSFP
jgi:hypothetical protein